MKALVDRSTLRALARTPGFTITVIVSLALAVGLTTTTFGIVGAVLHPYVPYRAPEQLYAVQTDAFDPSDDLLADMARSLRAQRQLFSDFAIVMPARAHPTIGVAGQTLDVYPWEASVNFFDMLGAPMFAGRGFRPEDRDAPDRAGVVVSYEFWRRYLHGAMPLSGVTVMVDGQAYSVIGVLAPDIRRGDVFLAMPRTTEEGWFYGGGPVLRVRPGVTEVQLTAALRAAAANLNRKYGPQHGIRYEVRSMAGTPRRLQPFQFALSGAALVILLIACANVANLLIVRVVTREREIAVRMALGASRRDVGRFVFGEAIVLAVAGGALGLLLAAWGIHLIEYRFTMDVSQIGLLQPHFDWRACGVSALASALVVVLIAWGATVRARATNVNEAIKDGAGTTTQPTHRSHGLLAVTEVALSLVVLMGAGLLLRANQAIRHFDFGYDPRHVVSTTMFRPRRDSTASLGEEFFAGVRNGIRALPGVRGVATTYEESVPASAVTSDVGGASPRVARVTTYSVVSPDFFHLIGVSAKQGRDFEPGDVDSAGAAIVDETLAKMLWPHESPLQHLLKLGGPRSNGPWVRVVGVVPPIRFSFSPDPDQALAVHPNVWVARAGRAHGAYDGRQLLIRTGADEASTLVGVSRYLRTIEPQVRPAYRPILEPFDQDIQLSQFLASLFGALAGFALLLSTVGLYSLLSYIVTRRRREFAMRVALGARSRDLVRLVIRDAMLLILGGTAVGAFGAMWTGRVMEHLLFTVNPLDALTLVAAEAVLIAISLAAVVGPAYRATRADPVELLRAT